MDNSTHFIVVGHGRSGTTMLSLALAAHPYVRMYLELFHRKPEDRRKYFCADRRRWHDAMHRLTLEHNVTCYKSDTSPIEFLRRCVFYSRFYQRRHAVGFKLLYNYSITGARYRQLLDYLRRKRNLRIIYVERNDMG